MPNRNRRPKSKKRKNPEASWFGFQKTTPEKKTIRVNRVFDKVSCRYDLMNDLMSLGLHRLWKDRMVALMRPRSGQLILDLASGTGDIALRCAEHTDGKAQVFSLDLNYQMLCEGRKKAMDRGIIHGINRLGGNAERLPFRNETFDVICVAFGLRNFAKIDTALKEIYRVLKPGGRFFCLEFSSGFAPWLKNIYDFYSYKFIPKLGELVVKDRSAYQYLVESIRNFPKQNALANRMRKAGFSQISWIDLMCGIAAIHMANRN